MTNASNDSNASSDGPPDAPGSSKTVVWKVNSEGLLAAFLTLGRDNHDPRALAARLVLFQKVAEARQAELDAVIAHAALSETREAAESETAALKTGWMRASNEILTHLAMRRATSSFEVEVKRACVNVINAKHFPREAALIGLLLEASAAADVAALGPDAFAEAAAAEADAPATPAVRVELAPLDADAPKH